MPDRRGLRRVNRRTGIRSHNGAGASPERTMSLRSLLVLVDRRPTCASRVRVAAQLAKHHGAHLLGVAPTRMVAMPPAIRSAATLDDLLARAKDVLRDMAEQAADAFRDQCHAAGLQSVSAIVDEADAVTSLVRQARCRDLAVISQADPADPDHAFNQALVQAMILNSARPTLVVPYAGAFGGNFEHVLVAWDDSREAARAASDALPLLQQARKVTLIGWDEHPRSGEPLRPRLDALHAWLRLHGIEADVLAQTTEIGIADALLSRTADLGADLVVMGAYGHARVSELVMGGATRGVLAAMTVPVLMSH
jgi:nucleotide-binding universal stress UspA family protein